MIIQPLLDGGWWRRCSLTQLSPVKPELNPGHRKALVQETEPTAFLLCSTKLLCMKKNEVIATVRELGERWCCRLSFPFLSTKYLNQQIWSLQGWFPRLPPAGRQRPCEANCLPCALPSRIRIAT